MTDILLTCPWRDPYQGTSHTWPVLTRSMRPHAITYYWIIIHWKIRTKPAVYTHTYHISNWHYIKSWLTHNNWNLLLIILMMILVVQPNTHSYLTSSGHKVEEVFPWEIFPWCCSVRQFYALCGVRIHQKEKNMVPLWLLQVNGSKLR